MLWTIVKTRVDRLKLHPIPRSNHLSESEPRRIVQMQHMTVFPISTHLSQTQHRLCLASTRHAHNQLSIDQTFRIVLQLIMQRKYGTLIILATVSVSVWNNRTIRNITQNNSEICYTLYSFLAFRLSECILQPAFVPATCAENLTVTNSRGRAK